MADIELLVKRLQEGTFGSDIHKTDAYLNTLMLQAAETIRNLRDDLADVTAELNGAYDVIEELRRYQT